MKTKFKKKLKSVLEFGGILGGFGKLLVSKI
jgi:hypothetical protein